MQAEAREGAGKVGGKGDETGKFDHRECVAYLATLPTKAPASPKKRSVSPAKKKAGAKGGKGAAGKKPGSPGKGGSLAKGGSPAKGKGGKASPPKGAKRKK